jgi:hypothetical protein
MLRSDSPAPSKLYARSTVDTELEILHQLTLSDVPQFPDSQQFKSFLATSAFELSLRHGGCCGVDRPSA